MKKLLTIIGLAAATLAGANAQVLITQYYEGASSDKYIELTNVGTTTFNFATTTLYLGLWSNANRGGWLTDAAPTTSSSISTGTLAAGASLVLKNSSAATPSYAATAGTSNGTINFNGDDSYAIWTGSSTFSTSLLVDTFGLAAGAASIIADTSFVRTGIGSVQTTGYSSVVDITGSGFWTQITNATANSALSGTNDYIGFSSVPEPSTWALIGIGAFVMIWTIRRRRALKA